MGVSTDCTWKKKTLDMSVLAVLFAPAMKRKSIGGVNLFCYLFFFLNYARLKDCISMVVLTKCELNSCIDP